MTLKLKFTSYLVLIAFLLCPFSSFAADTKISDLTALGERPARTDEFVLVDSSTGVTKKIDFISMVDIPNVDDYGGLVAAVAAIGGAATSLIVDTEQTMANDLTIPATMNLIVLRGGSIARAAGKILTVNGTISAGAYEIFTGTGTTVYAADGIYLGAWDGDNSVRITINGSEQVVISDNNFIFKASSGNDLIMPIRSDAGEDNADLWRFKVVDGANFALESYSTGAWVEAWHSTPAERLWVGDLSAVGADPLCFSGAAGSLIGDCTSAIEAKGNIEKYNLPHSGNKVRSLPKKESDRVKVYYPNERKQYSSNTEMLMDIEVYTFNLNEHPEQAEEDEIGVIAEQVYAINPMLVNIRKKKDGNKVTGIAWFNMISWLIKVNQEQQERIEILEDRVSVLEAR